MDRPRPSLLPRFAGAAFALALVSLFIFPSVRASAQAFLDLFRVRSFTAVPFDPARLEQFDKLDKDIDLILFEDGKPSPNPPSDAASVADAAAVTGIPVLEPAWLPGLVRDRIQTTENNHMRVGTSTATLKTVVEALGLDDVDVPEGLDGQWIDVNLHPAAIQSWSKDKLHLKLVQARSPNVVLPAGLDLAHLGEIGLRILGLDAREASRVAASVDWNSTLLVPVPVNASGFREVTVRGTKGLLITTSRPHGEDGEARRDGGLLLWAEGDRVLALAGNVTSEDLMAIAESLK